MLLACRCEYANLHDYPHIQSSNNRPLTHLVGSKLMTAHTEAGLAPTFLFIKAIDTNLFRSQLTSQAPLSRLPTRPTSLTPTGVALRGRCRDIQTARETCGCENRAWKPKRVCSHTVVARKPFAALGV